MVELANLSIFGDFRCKGAIKVDGERCHLGNAHLVKLIKAMVGPDRRYDALGNNLFYLMARSA